MLLATAIKGHLMDLKIGGCTQKHIDEVERELERFCCWCEQQEVTDLNAVDAMTLKGYILHLQELRVSDKDVRVSMRGRKISPVTAQDYMRKVRTFFFWSEREGYLRGANPVHRIPNIKAPQRVLPAFTPEQMRQMLEGCDVSTPLGFRDYTILMVLLDTGLRVSELCTLTLNDVRDDYLLVFGKNSKEREAGISPTTSRELFKYINQFRPPAIDDDSHIFLSYRGRPLDRRKIWGILNELAEKVGIQGVRSSPHTARHSFAKEWLVKGGDIASLSRLLGHTDIQTTQIYLKSFQSQEARQQHSKFSPIESNKLGRRTSSTRKKGSKKK